MPGQYGEPLTYAHTISSCRSAGGIVKTLETILRLWRRLFFIQIPYNVKKNKQNPMKNEVRLDLFDKIKNK